MKAVKQPYIIAEMNSSHNGSLDRAIQMVDAAIDCKCDCVKFQSWTSESLYSDEFYHSNPINERIVKKFALDKTALREIATYCRNKGIDFSSTPYSEQEVDYLVDELNAPFIKIASMEINNLPYLRYIAKKRRPMILSTGMSTIDEIKAAVDAIEDTGNDQLCILHCVSIYPAKASEINLNNIVLLKNTFPNYEIGYSDHTIGYEVASAAVALGASVIEKHFTLDNSKMGMDNNMATEPETMKELVTACHNVYEAMGSYDRVLSENELLQRLKMRRSLVAKRNIEAGEVIQEDDIEAKRPGDGIPPTEEYKIIGHKLKRNYLKGYKIDIDNIE